MKNLIFKLGTGLFFGALGSAAFAADNVIDFETFTGMSNSPGTSVPSGSQLSNQFLNTLGINFASNSPYVAVVELGTNHATSGINGIGGTNNVGELSYAASTPIEMTFWDPTNTSVAAGTDFFSLRGDEIPDGSTVTLNAYDANNVLLSSLSMNDTGGITMALSSANKDMHRLEFIGSGTVAVDDVSFNKVAPVPEPASIAALGLGSLLILRRRKSSK